MLALFFTLCKLFSFVSLVSDYLEFRIPLTAYFLKNNRSEKIYNPT